MLKLLFLLDCFLILGQLNRLAILLKQILVTLDAWVVICHKQLNDVLWNSLGVCNVKLFVIVLETNRLESFHYAVWHFVYLLVELLKHCRVEEEPHTMAEEEVSLRCQYHHVKERTRVFKVAFKVEWAKLRNIELQVVSKHRSEIRVDSALFKVLYCAWLMCIHPDHSLCHVVSFILSGYSVIKIEPLFKPLDKGLLSNCFWLLTAYATTKGVVKAATCSENAA